MQSVRLRHISALRILKDTRDYLLPCVVATTTFLTACVAVPQPASAEATRTRIVETACGNYDSETQSRGIGESALSSLIGNTLGRIGSALRSAGEESTSSIVVNRNTSVVAGQPSKCLIIARGVWSANPSQTFKYANSSEVVYFGRSAQRLQIDPDFFLMLDVDMSADASALRLRPKFLEYRRHLTDDRGDIRGLAVELAFYGPGQSSDHKDAIGTSLVLGDFEPGHRYDLVTGDTERLDRSGNWRRIDSKKPALEEESRWFPTYAPKPVAGTEATAKKSGSPKTITATIAETRAARPILLFLADIFDESKEAIQTDLEKKLLKSQREQIQADAASARNDQLVQLVTAIADANVAISKYCEMGDKPLKSAYFAARKDVFIAQNAANFIASSQGHPLPFANVFAPSGDKPSDSGFCPDAAN